MRFTTILICTLVCIFVTSVKADDVASSSDNAAVAEPAGAQQPAPVAVQEPAPEPAPVADPNEGGAPSNGDVQQQPVSSDQ